MALITLAELLVINDMNLADLDVTDILNEAPFLSLLAADVASNGTQHKYVKETTAPTVGFRDVNVGRAHSKSGDTLVTITLKHLDASFSIDKALADQYKGGPNALVSREARRHLRAAFFMAEKQIINGTGNSADGFTGLVNASTIDGTGDTMVVNAGNATANSVTSVYAVRTNADLNDVVVVTGQDGQITIGETAVQFLDVANDGALLPAYCTPMGAWLALQIGSAQSVGRICNIGASANKLTDALIAQLLAKFPASRQPTHLVMSRQSRMQLQQSRTATSSTGAPAPFPTESFGVPIVTSDGVLNTEAVVA